MDHGEKNDGKSGKAPIIRSDSADQAIDDLGKQALENKKENSHENAKNIEDAGKTKDAAKSCGCGCCGKLPSWWRSLSSDTRFVIVFITTFCLARFFVYDYYIVPSSSMVPTLLIGDMPLVEKWAYGYSKHSVWFSPNLFSGRILFRNNVKRGEVIVFKAPEDNDTNVIKRVIGLPGDKVSVESGVVCVNGVRAKLTPKGKTVYKDTGQDKFYELTLYDEVLPLTEGTAHTVAYLEEGVDAAQNHFKEVVVPEGHYFVMGDNRDCSKDSRCGLGLVPAENLMGHAVRTIHSIGNGVRLWEPWLWFQNIRYDRILKKIM
jgi:signal peptidase I